MVWWQIILIMLLGVFPNILAAIALGFVYCEIINQAKISGEVNSQYKGLQSILGRIEKLLKNEHGLQQKS